jgi:hypothetical protein
MATGAYEIVARGDVYQQSSQRHVGDTRMLRTSKSARRLPGLVNTILMLME